MGAHKRRSYSGYQNRREDDNAPATIRNQARKERTMERYETQNSQFETSQVKNSQFGTYDIEIQRDDEQSALIAKVMVSVVAAMALIVMATVVVFSSGGSVLA